MSTNINIADPRSLPLLEHGINCLSTGHRSVVGEGNIPERSDAIYTFAQDPPMHVLTALLKLLLLLAGASGYPVNDVILLSRVLEEVETWCKGSGSGLAYQAQITMVHVSGDPTSATSYLEWTKTPAEISLDMYLYLMRRVKDSGYFKIQVKQRLEAVIQDAESWLAMTKLDGVTEAKIDDKLCILHGIGDYYVAYYSVMGALHYFKSPVRYLRTRPLVSNLLPRIVESIFVQPFRSQLGDDFNETIQTSIEFLACLGGRERVKMLCILADTFHRRFLHSLRVQDLDDAMERLLEAGYLSRAYGVEDTSIGKQFASLFALRAESVKDNVVIPAVRQALRFMWSVVSISTMANTKSLPPLTEFLSGLANLLSLKETIIRLGPDRVLLRNVHKEIAAWVNAKDSKVTWNAQIALAHSAIEGDAATHYIDWSKSFDEISVTMYLHLMQGAYDSRYLDKATRSIFQKAFQDVELWQSSAMPASTQLQKLQCIGDYSVACYSLAEAITHIWHLLSHPAPVYRLSNILPRSCSERASAAICSDNISALTQVKQGFAERLMFCEGIGREQKLNTFGSLLYRLFELCQGESDLNNAITAFDESLQHAPDGRLRPLVLFRSGLARYTRFQQFQNITDVQVGVTHVRQALQCVPASGDVYLTGSRLLADLLWARYEQTEAIEDINDWVKLAYEILSLLPAGSKLRAEFISELGTNLWYRFKRLHSMDDLDSAIYYLQEARTLAPSNPAVAGNLGNALLSRFECLGNGNDLDAAINISQHVANLDPSCTCFHNLANAFMMRFNKYGTVDDLDSAVMTGRMALDAARSDDRDYPEYLSGQGTRLAKRWMRIRRKNDLDQAITYLQQAFDLTPQNSMHKGRRTVDLTQPLVMRYRIYGESKDIDRVTQLLEASMELYNLDSHQLSAILINIGDSRLARFHRSQEFKDLSLAVEALEKAIVFEPNAHSTHELSLALALKHRMFGDPTDLDLAIKHARSTVALVPPEHYMQAHYSLHLGTTLLQRFLGKSFNAVGRRLPSRLCQQLDTYIQQVHSELKRQAVSALAEIMHRPLNSDHNDAMSALQSSAANMYGDPSLRFQAALIWASVAVWTQDISSAVEGYVQAIHLLPLVAWIGYGATSQLGQIADNEMIQYLPCQAAMFLCILARRHPEHHQRYLAQAVEILDQGRSILWSQASQFKHDITSLRQINPELAEDLDQVGRAMNESCFDEHSLNSDDGAVAYRHLTRRWEELLHRIRQLPEFESFLLPLSISHLREAAKDGPVIIVNASLVLWDIIILRDTGDLLSVPISVEALDKLQTAVHVSANQVREQESRAGRQAKANDQLPGLLYICWEDIVLPAIAALGHQVPSRVWWCLTGKLASIPIHAACPRPEPGKQLLGLMDLTVSSYTPTISALLRSQKRPQAPNKSHLLAIGQSGDLEMVRKELDAISNVFRLAPDHQVTVLQDEAATVELVAGHLPNATWVHFACHGIQNHGKPMDSGLKMYDGLFTLSKLAQMPLKSADFAFLSCCQSATGSKQFYEESLHLAAGMQFIGFHSVIGTLWSVGDEEAYHIAKHVYEGFFKDSITNPDSRDAARLLNWAARYLRDELKVPLQRWVPFVHFGM